MLNPEVILAFTIFNFWNKFLCETDMLGSGIHQSVYVSLEY